MTHVNALYMEVDEAKEQLKLAEANLSAKEEALKAHPDYEAPKKVAEDKRKPEKKVKS